MPLLFQTTSWIGRNFRENSEGAFDHLVDDDRCSVGLSHSLNFRFETFNTLNHPTWNVPANDPRNLATFGVITSAGAMRQLQFALKYSF